MASQVPATARRCLLGRFVFTREGHAAMAGTETQYEEDGEPSAQEPSSSSSSSIATGTLAYTHPLTDRRRASRAKQKFVTQMTPWSPGVPSIPFEVILDDISETGAGVLVERPCQLGMRYLL